VVADPARVGDSDRKGTVENAVKYTQNTAEGTQVRKHRGSERVADALEQRWASLRIHGRVKRQVEEMFQEEKPYLQPLPLMPFRYFQQEIRTVYDDGTTRSANPTMPPARLRSAAGVVRIYEDQVEILDPVRMEVIRGIPEAGGRVP